MLDDKKEILEAQRDSFGKSRKRITDFEVLKQVCPIIDGKFRLLEITTKPNEEGDFGMPEIDLKMLHLTEDELTELFMTSMFFENDYGKVRLPYVRRK